MPAEPDEQLLRADVETAKNSLDAARDGLQGAFAADTESRLLYQGARERYAVALRRFSALVINAPLPPLV